MTLLHAGHGEEAAAQLAATGQWEALAGLVQDQAPGLMRQGRYQTLAGWLAMLPETIMSDHGWLLYWRGVTRLASNPVSAQGDMEYAYGWFVQRADAIGMRLSCAGVLQAATVTANWALSPAMDQWAERLLDLQTQGAALSAPEELAVQLDCAMLVALTSWRPLHFGVRWPQEAAVLSQRMRDPAPLLLPTVSLVTLFGALGRKAEQQQVSGFLEQLLPRVSAQELAGPWFRLQRCIMAVIDAVLGADQGAADQAVAECLAIAERYGIRQWRNLIVLHQLLVALAREDLHSAARAVAQMLTPAAEDDPLSHAAFFYGSGLLALRSGDGLAARSHGEQALRASYQITDPLVKTSCHLLLAEVALEQGRLEEAEGHLQHAEELHALVGTGPLAVDTAMLWADVALSGARGEVGEAQRPAVRRAMTIAVAVDVVNTPHWHPPRLRRVLRAALGADIEPAYARRLILRRRLLADKDVVAEGEWAWSLKIRVLGALRVERDGEVIRPPGRVVQRLLMVLLAGPAPAAVEQIADRLWPEAEGDQGRRNLDTNLHRLRRWLGGDQGYAGVLLTGGQIELDQRFFWVDLWELEALLCQVEAARREGRQAQAALRRLEELYRGPLHGEEELVLAAARRRIARRVERLRVKE